MQSKEHWEIDLHGFRRDEAIHVLKEFLDKARGSSVAGCSIITGVGRNSDDGVSVLRYAVLSFLNERGYHYVEQSFLGEFNGVIEVSI